MVNAGIRKAEATNFKGHELVTDALMGLLDKPEGRIVNVSSGAANMWLTQQNTETNKLSANPDISGEDLEAAVNQNVAAKNSKILNKYIKDIVDRQMSKHILVTGGNSGKVSILGVVALWAIAWFFQQTRGLVTNLCYESQF